MNHNTFALTTEDAAHIGRELQEGKTLPLSWYTDPGVLAAELDLIYSSTWQYIGRAADVAESGQFVTAEIAGRPIVVVRDRDGSLNAFHNVCRHRAAKVVLEECGQRRALQCHYHAWTYGLDGSLKGAPRSRSETGFPQSELGLRRASAATWGPFLFANLDPDAEPLDTQLADVPALTAGAGIDVDNLRFHFRVTYDLRCNWKIAIENYLECYHCPTAHPGFSHVLDTDMTAYRLVLGSNHAWQNGPLRQQNPGATPELGYTGRDGAVPEGRYFALFPNMKVNINPGLPNLSIGPVVPMGPENSHGFLDYYFGPDVTQEWIDDMIVFDNEVGAEDTVLVESVQHGIRSGAIQQGRIMLESEKLIAGYQAWLLDKLAGKA